MKNNIEHAKYCSSCGKRFKNKFSKRTDTRVFLVALVVLLLLLIWCVFSGWRYSIYLEYPDYRGSNVIRGPERPEHYVRENQAADFWGRSFGESIYLFMCCSVLLIVYSNARKRKAVTPGFVSIIVCMSCGKSFTANLHCCPHCGLNEKQAKLSLAMDEQNKLQNKGAIIPHGPRLSQPNRKIPPP